MLGAIQSGSSGSKSMGEGNTESGKSFVFDTIRPCKDRAPVLETRTRLPDFAPCQMRGTRLSDFEDEYAQCYGSNSSSTRLAELILWSHFV